MLIAAPSLGWLFDNEDATANILHNNFLNASPNAVIMQSVQHSSGEEHQSVTRYLPDGRILNDNRYRPDLDAAWELEAEKPEKPAPPMVRCYGNLHEPPPRPACPQRHHQRRSPSPPSPCPCQRLKALRDATTLLRTTPGDVIGASAILPPSPPQSLQPAEPPRPTKEEWKVGDPIAAYWDVDASAKGWYTGRIASVNEAEGSFGVSFDDGDHLEKVSRERIRPLTTEALARRPAELARYAEARKAAAAAEEEAVDEEGEPAAHRSSRCEGKQACAACGASGTKVCIATAASTRHPNGLMCAGKDASACNAKEDPAQEEGEEATLEEEEEEEEEEREEEREEEGEVGRHRRSEENEDRANDADDEEGEDEASSSATRSSSSSGGGVDYDALARETVSMTPSRSRGVREEWDSRVGWGRKEALRTNAEPSTSASSGGAHTTHTPPPATAISPLVGREALIEGRDSLIEAVEEAREAVETASHRAQRASDKAERARYRGNAAKAARYEEKSASHELKLEAAVRETARLGESVEEAERQIRRHDAAEQAKADARLAAKAKAQAKAEVEAEAEAKAQARAVAEEAGRKVRAQAQVELEKSQEELQALEKNLVHARHKVHAAQQAKEGAEKKAGARRVGCAAATRRA